MLDTVERTLSLIAAALVLVLALLTAADVVLRYGFSNPVPGAWELSQLLLVGVVFLGVAHAQTTGRHVRVELLLTRAGPATRRWLDLAALVAGLVVFGLMLWTGLVDTWKAWATGDYTLGSIAFAVWPSKLMIPVGSLFLCLRLLVQVLGWLDRRGDEAVAADRL